MQWHAKRTYLLDGTIKICWSNICNSPMRWQESRKRLCPHLLVQEYILLGWFFQNLQKETHSDAIAIKSWTFHKKIHIQEHVRIQLKVLGKSMIAEEFIVNTRKVEQNNYLQGNPLVHDWALTSTYNSTSITLWSFFCSHFLLMHEWDGNSNARNVSRCSPYLGLSWDLLTCTHSPHLHIKEKWPN